MIRKLTKTIPALLVAALMAACGTTAVSDRPGASAISAQTTHTPIAATETQNPFSPSTVNDEAVLALSHKDPSERVVTPFETGKAVVIFTFDDGHASDYLLAYPILKQYGIKGTSYINTKFTDEKLKGRLSWEQIKKMSEYGWVFGGHTSGHQHMTKLSDEKIKTDCEAVRASFINQGLEPPEIMAYPYGNYNSRVIDAIKPYYTQARLAGRADLVDPASVDPYRIPSVSADMQSQSKLKRWNGS